MEACAQNQKVQKTNVARGLLGKNHRLFREYNLQCLQSMNEDCTEEEEMRSQQRMKLMKDFTKKIRSRGWMNAKNRWWVADLLAANCEKAWPHSVEETKMQGWFSWLEDLKKKDEKKQMEEMHQQQASWLRVPKAVRGSCTKSQNPQHGEEEHRF